MTQKTTLTDTRFYIRCGDNKKDDLIGFFVYQGVPVAATIDRDMNIQVRKVGANNQPLKSYILAGKVEKFESDNDKAPSHQAIVTTRKGDRRFQISIWRHTDEDRGDTYYSANMQERRVRNGEAFL